LANQSDGIISCNTKSKLLTPDGSIWILTTTNF